MQCLALLNIHSSSAAGPQILSWHVFQSLKPVGHTLLAGLSSWPTGLSVLSRNVAYTFHLSSESEGSWGGWAFAATAGFAAVWGTSHAFTEQKNLTAQGPPRSPSCMSVNWVQQLAAQEDAELVLSAEHIHAHPLLSKDHMVSASFDTCTIVLLFSLAQTYLGDLRQELINVMRAVEVRY